MALPIRVALCAGDAGTRRYLSRAPDGRSGDAPTPTPGCFPRVLNTLHGELVLHEQGDGGERPLVRVLRRLEREDGDHGGVHVGALHVHVHRAHVVARIVVVVGVDGDHLDHRQHHAQLLGDGVLELAGGK
eukprot:2174157-Pyramimonas_sp.AAC.1